MKILFGMVFFSVAICADTESRGQNQKDWTDEQWQAFESSRLYDLVSALGRVDI